MKTGMIYEINMPGRVTAGEGSMDRLSSMVSDFGLKKVLIITDTGVWKAGLIDYPLKVLKDAGIETGVIKSLPSEPEVGMVRSIHNQVAGQEYEGVIGIGGGSAMDAAKLISVLLTNKCDIEDLLNTGRIMKYGLPMIMVPTTAGTGSEATQNAIVTIPEQDLKVGIVNSRLVPDCVILDPTLTVKLPPAITAYTGMDAFTHALECYISAKANTLSDTYALKAIKLIYGSIRTAFVDGNNLKVRHDMLLGSFFGGMCIASSGTAAVHALAYPLGGRYRIPHGISNAMLLAHVTEFNRDSITEKLKDIAIAMEICTSETSMESAADQVIECLHKLTGDLGIPCSLREYGISENDLEDIVQAAAKVTRLLDNNPKRLEIKDMMEIYKKIL